MKKWITLTLVLLPVSFLALHVYFQMYPARGASIHFIPTTSRDSDWLAKHSDEIKTHLLDDGRLISAYALPENQSKRIMFGRNTSDWPLYGVKGSEFENAIVTVDELAAPYEKVGTCICVSINFRSSERYSKKIRDLKKLISSAIGEEEMQNISISIEVESIIPRWGDGA